MLNRYRKGGGGGMNQGGAPTPQMLQQLQQFAASKGPEAAMNQLRNINPQLANQVHAQLPPQVANRVGQMMGSPATAGSAQIGRIDQARAGQPSQIGQMNPGRAQPQQIGGGSGGSGSADSSGLGGGGSIIGQMAGSGVAPSPGGPQAAANQMFRTGPTQAQGMPGQSPVSVGMRPVPMNPTTSVPPQAAAEANKPVSPALAAARAARTAAFTAGGGGAPSTVPPGGPIMSMPLMQPQGGLGGLRVAGTPAAGQPFQQIGGGAPQGQLDPFRAAIMATRGGPLAGGPVPPQGPRPPINVPRPQGPPMM